MQWLKTLLMKWLGVDGVRVENNELIRRLDALDSNYSKTKERLENLCTLYLASKEDGDGHMARLDRELIDIVKTSERDSRRISELETLVRDATLDTALAALEDRVSKIEATPVPAPGAQGRRGGSAWGPHQVAAAAGAARGNGADIPIPTPGVS